MTAFDPQLAARIAESGIPLSADLVQDTGRLTAEREAEILKFRDDCHPVTGILAAARVHDSLADLADELAAVRKERDELEARARRLVEQWNERAETWAPLSSPENNREGFERYRTLCSAYCEAADNLHNVLAGIDPDVPWHHRGGSGAVS